MENQPKQNEKYLNLTQLSADTGLGINYIKTLRNQPGAPFMKLGTARRAHVVTKRSEFEQWLKSYSKKCKSA